MMKNPARKVLNLPCGVFWFPEISLLPLFEHPETDVYKLSPDKITELSRFWAAGKSCTVKTGRYSGTILTAPNRSGRDKGVSGTRLRILGDRELLEDLPGHQVPQGLDYRDGVSVHPVFGPAGDGAGQPMGVRVGDGTDLLRQQDMVSPRSSPATAGSAGRETP